MNVIEAVVSVFSRYFEFSGRSRRSEYWWYLLFYLVLTAVTGLADSDPLGVIVGLAVLMPTIAVGVRRLHDIDRTGWWLLLSFIPLIGTVILLYWATRKGTEGANRFGPDPIGAADTADAAFG